MYRHNMLLQQATATGYGQTSFDASARPCRRWSHPRGKTTGLQLSVLRGQLLILHLQLPNGSHQPPRFPRARIPVALKPGIAALDALTTTPGTGKRFWSSTTTQFLRKRRRTRIKDGWVSVLSTPRAPLGRGRRVQAPTRPGLPPSSTLQP